MDVCPWNRFATQNATADFQFDNQILSMTDADWEQLGEEKFDAIFKKTPLKRIGFEKLMQNVGIV
jgi:epoxyqueuosine reductase